MEEGAARSMPRLPGIAPTSDALLSAVHFATLISTEKQMWADVSIFIWGARGRGRYSQAHNKTK